MILLSIWKLSCCVSYEQTLYIPSIGWVISMTLGVILITLSFVHRLVMLLVPMEPLSVPPMSQSCPDFHVDSMLSISIHLHYAIVRREFLSQFGHSLVILSLHVDHS